MYLAALVVGAVLGDVDRRAAVLAAEREALREPQRDEQDRREDSDLLVRRQQADEGGRKAHHGDRHEERELAADDVADPAEDGGAERPHREPGAERGERRQQRRRVVALREELGGEERHEDAVEVEVVPLDHGADRRGSDHERQACSRSRYQRARTWSLQLLPSSTLPRWSPTGRRSDIRRGQVGNGRSALLTSRLRSDLVSAHDCRAGLRAHNAEAVSRYTRHVSRSEGRLRSPASCRPSLHSPVMTIETPAAASVDGTPADAPPRIFSGIQPSGVAAHRQRPRRDPQLRRAAGPVRGDLLHRRLPRADEHATTRRCCGVGPARWRHRCSPSGSTRRAARCSCSRTGPRSRSSTWLFTTVTPVSWLERTPTYKEKRENQPDDLNHGLLHLPGPPGRRHRPLQGVAGAGRQGPGRASRAVARDRAPLQHAVRRHVPGAAGRLHRGAGGPRHGRRRAR